MLSLLAWIWVESSETPKVFLLSLLCVDPVSVCSRSTSCSQGLCDTQWHPLQLAKRMWQSGLFLSESWMHVNRVGDDRMKERSSSGDPALNSPIVTSLEFLLLWDTDKGKDESKGQSWRCWRTRRFLSWYFSPAQCSAWVFFETRKGSRAGTACQSSDISWGHSASWPLSHLWWGQSLLSNWCVHVRACARVQMYRWGEAEKTKVSHAGEMFEYNPCHWQFDWLNSEYWLGFRVQFKTLVFL